MTETAMSVRFVWRDVRAELEQLEAFLAEPNRASLDGLAALAMPLCRFADTVTSVGALRRAVALAMGDARVRWDPTHSLWAAIITLKYPALERQRRSELVKAMSVVGQLPPRDAVRALAAAGGAEALGRLSEAQLDEVRRRLRARYNREWRPASF